MLWRRLQACRRLTADFLLFYYSLITFPKLNAIEKRTIKVLILIGFNPSDWFRTKGRQLKYCLSVLDCGSCYRMNSIGFF